MASGIEDRLVRRGESLRARIDALLDLRPMVGLGPGQELAASQWTAIELRLKQARSRLLAELDRALVPRQGEPARRINARLGAIELELSRAYTFFDTYLDVLTQRLIPQVGAELAGCDVIAAHALLRPHPALELVPPPLVYLDRGFGASILRAGVRLPDASLNPTPLIQIPYSRLQSKQNLNSILHECGHEALIRLGLIRPISSLLHTVVRGGGGSQRLADHFALWSSEIGPDFWGFCLSGAAQAASLRELLALAPELVLNIPWGDPHPPPYLRVLLAIEWCRQSWGSGAWDAWEKEWRQLYPSRDSAAGAAPLLKEAELFVPAIARALLGARFHRLERRTIGMLFDLDAIAPRSVSALAGRLARGEPAAAAPSVVLAAFRQLRETGTLDERTLDRRLSSWLIRLGERRRVHQKGSFVA